MSMYTQNYYSFGHFVPNSLASVYLYTLVWTYYFDHSMSDPKNNLSNLNGIWLVNMQCVEILIHSGCQHTLFYGFKVCTRQKINFFGNFSLPHVTTLVITLRLTSGPTVHTTNSYNKMSWLQRNFTTINEPYHHVIIRFLYSTSLQTAIGCMSLILD